MRLGTDVPEELIKRKRGCCSCKLTCSLKVWKENVKQNQNGETWLKILLTFQILYFLAYLGINAFNHQNTMYKYELFIIIIVAWLIVGAVYFLRNVVSILLSNSH